LKIQEVAGFFLSVGSEHKGKGDFKENPKNNQARWNPRPYPSHRHIEPETAILCVVEQKVLHALDCLQKLSLFSSREVSKMRPGRLTA
jgi:hypothetical protein